MPVVTLTIEEYEALVRDAAHWRETSRTSRRDRWSRDKVLAQARVLLNRYPPHLDLARLEQAVKDAEDFRPIVWRPWDDEYE